MEGLDPNLLLAQMGKGDDDDKTLWLFLLLLMFGGRRGFGGGDYDGVGVNAPATLQDLNAAQNAVSASILDVNRDIASNAVRNDAGQARINELVQQCCFGLQSGQCDIRTAVGAVGTQLGLGLKDIEKAICDCCCQLGIGQKELENKLLQCCCETQRQMAVGFADVNHNMCMQENRITQAIHTDGEATRALITQNRMDDLQSALQIARDENSNLRQTDRIAEIVREQCGHHGPWWGNGGGPPGPPWAAAPAATGKK